MGDSIVSRLLALDPSRPAVHLVRGHGKGGFRDEVLTVGDWLRGARASAAILQSHGVRRGDRVLLCVPTGRSFLEKFLGALWIGAVPVPLPSLEGFARPAAFVARLASVVGDASPTAVFADRRTAAYLQSSGLVNDDLPVLEDSFVEGSAPEASPAEGMETAFIQYTSGSTGTPRGVVVTAGNLAANVAAMGRALKLTPDDRVVSWLPLYHDMGLIGGLLAPAAHGAACWLLSPLEFLLRPASWLQALSVARATLTVAPNFAYGLVARKVTDADLSGLDFSSLRAAINGAEPVDPATAEAFCARLAPMGLRASSYFPVYGLAESTLSVAFPPLDRGVKIDRVERAALAAGQAVPAASAEGSVAVVSVGRALEEVAIMASGGHDHEHLPERRLGEIIVRGPSVSPWYFEKHQPRRERRTWLRTGDLGYLADGELYVVDRLKDVIIVAGRNYAPTDIERTVEKVDGLRAGRSVAFGVPDEKHATEALVIAAEVQPRSRAELGRLREAVRAALLEQIGLAPADVRLVHPGALARTSSGKLMRRDARERYLAGALDRSHALQPMLPIRLAQAVRAAVFRWLAARRASQP